MKTKSYKFRIYPNKTQKVQLSKTFGCVRFLWNKNVESWNNKSEFKSSTEYRIDYDFLREVSAAAIQQKERDFDQFKKQCFNKNRKKALGNPRFKSKKDKQAFRLPNQKFKIINNKLQLEKIGRVKIILDREITGKFLSVTVSMDSCGDYFASIVVQTEIQEKPKTNNSVGIDLGIKELITTSDGLQVKRLSDNQVKIKHAQKRLSRKVKGSTRWNKLRLRLAKLHRKQARRREWLLHNISTHLVNNYDLIVTEDLNVAGMLKNHNLARVVSDASWSELVRQLEYKCEWYGKDFHKIDRFFPSSKMCSNCGVVKESLKLSERTYSCECGLSIDRDLNAAINIKTVGVDAVNQTAMECKTYSISSDVEQAIPSDLLNFL